MIHIKSYPGCKSRMLASQTLVLDKSKNEPTIGAPKLSFSKPSNKTHSYCAGFKPQSQHLAICTKTFFGPQPSASLHHLLGSAVRQAAHLLNVKALQWDKPHIYSTSRLCSETSRASTQTSRLCSETSRTSTQRLGLSDSFKIATSTSCSGSSSSPSSFPTASPGLGHSAAATSRTSETSATASCLLFSSFFEPSSQRIYLGK